MIKFTPNLIKGIALSRYKRFTVKVQLPNTQIVEAYCPNTGPMTGVWQEKRVCWIQQKAAGGKLPYVMRLMETDTALVGVDTHLPNLIIKQALVDRQPEWLMKMLPEFHDFEAEVKLDKSWRVDFLLRNQDRVIPLEVKNVLWKPEQSLAAFPDTVTTRGQKHIHNLTKFAEEHDTTSIVLYVIQRSDCDKFTIAKDKDPQYWQLWQNNSRVQSIAVSCQVSHTDIRLHKIVPCVNINNDLDSN